MTNPARLNSLIITLPLRRNALPELCTMARLGVVSPPMNSETPTMPSRPTMAISAESPSAVTYSNDTMHDVGKYTWVNLLPGSESTCPSDRSTDSKCGSHSVHSGSVNAARSWFSRGLDVTQENIAHGSATLIHQRSRAAWRRS